jgi:hypothetical protein
LLNQQIPTAEGALQEKEVQYYDGRKALAPVEAHQFVLLTSKQWHTEWFDGSTGEQSDVCPCIHE